MGAEVIVIGGGLAGSEAAWQAAQRGLQVVLYEMRPARMTPAHTTDRLAELVCSNSLGSDLPDRAAGLLKAELRRLGSMVLACADATAVPAGGALAVDREAFAAEVTRRVESHPRIRLVREEVTALPAAGPVVVATGPLTSPALAQALAALAGAEHLSFYDAMAPIVAADSVDLSVAFRASRYGRAAPLPPSPVLGRGAGGEGIGPGGEGPPSPVLGRGAGGEGGAEAGAEGAGAEGDYLNCPMDRAQYECFVEALLAAETLPLRDFEREDARFFEACLPVEELARRGPQALAFGPLKPVGLRDPRTGRRPYAVVQLRQDNLAATLYNLVGFQTNLKWGEQERVFRLIPGLERAEFVRYGQMHRNTFVNAPALLRPTLQWRARDDLLLAGQITGTEGYIGSTASGWLAGTNAARLARGEAPLELPPTTMIGALCAYVSGADPADFQPMKANFGLLPPLDPPVRDKRARYAAYAQRALEELEGFLQALDGGP